MDFVQTNMMGDASLNIHGLTDRVMVMGNFYENDKLNEVRTYYTTKFSNHHTIYNVSSEPEFNIEQDLDNVRNYPFNANNPCAIKAIIAFCVDVEAYLNTNTRNVIAIHCRTGLGRSCMMAACYLMHSGVCTTAQKAVDFVNRLRCPESHDALTCPSQIRYVHYYEALLRSESVKCSTYRISHIRITTVPSFSSSLIDCGCTPVVSVSVLGKANSNNSNDVNWYPKRVFNQIDALGLVKPRQYSSERDHVIEISLDKYDVHVRGDVCLGVFSEEEKMFQICFNTCFIQDNYLSFEKRFVDMAADDVFHYTFDANFKIEINLQAVPDEPALNILPSLRSTSSAAVKQELEFIHSYGDTNIPEVMDEHQ